MDARVPAARAGLDPFDALVGHQAGPLAGRGNRHGRARELGMYYYNSIRRVFRILTHEPPNRDDRAVDLTHAFLVEKIWSEDSPLLRNGEKLNKMRAEEDAGEARRAFRAYLQKALYNFLCTRSKDFRHAPLDMDLPEEGELAENPRKSLAADQNVDELMRTAMADELLSEAVQRLEERDRRLVEVRLSGESWEEYARREGKSPAAVRQCWVRLIPKLRICLEGLLEAECPEKLERDEELRECLRLADRKGQLLELLNRNSPRASTSHD